MLMRSDLLQYRNVLVSDDAPYLDLVHFHHSLIKELQRKAEQ